MARLHGIVKAMTVEKEMVKWVSVINASLCASWFIRQHCGQWRYHLEVPRWFFLVFFPPPQRQVAALAPVHQCAAPHWHTHSHNCDTYQPPLCFCLCYRKQTRATMFVLRIRGECVHFDVISSDIFLTDCVCVFCPDTNYSWCPALSSVFFFPSD